MAHAHTSRIQEYIGDPVSDAPPVEREQLEEIFQDIQADLRVGGAYLDVDGRVAISEADIHLAANEIAVAAFLERKIAFTAIPALIEETLAAGRGRERMLPHQ